MPAETAALLLLAYVGLIYVYARGAPWPELPQRLKPLAQRIAPRYNSVKGWVACSCVVVLHYQTLILIGGVRPFWPRSVQTLLACASLDYSCFTLAECMVGLTLHLPVPRHCLAFLLPCRLAVLPSGHLAVLPSLFRQVDLTPELQRNLDARAGTDLVLMVLVYIPMVTLLVLLGLRAWSKRQTRRQLSKQWLPLPRHGLSYLVGRR